MDPSNGKYSKEGVSRQKVKSRADPSSGGRLQVESEIFWHTVGLVQYEILQESIRQRGKIANHRDDYTTESAVVSDESIRCLRLQPSSSVTWFGLFVKCQHRLLFIR